MLETRNVSKLYTRSGEEIRALDSASLHIEKGEFVTAYGHSGSGKSTLLLLLGGMLRPTSGNVLFHDQDLYAQSFLKRNQYRKSVVGFVFQKFYLMPYLTVYDNIRLLLSIRSIEHTDRDRIESFAERLGIAGRLQHRPAELSVGEQQRAALARTLAGEPEIILADEPTGNLDKENSAIIARCLQEEHKAGKTIILATHDEALMELGTKKIQLAAGKIVSEN